MSKEFIQRQVNSNSLQTARTQQSQLLYFTKSGVQEDFITTEYLQQWANRKFETSDYFFNWLKNILKDSNFLTIFNYLRKPYPSAGLINDQIYPSLKRVFWSEDSIFNYEVDRLEEVDFISELKPIKFNQMVFDQLLFRHNNILITDLEPDQTNTPFRTTIDIERVVSISVRMDSTIERLAYSASLVVFDELGEPTEKKGYIYIDSEMYAFYDSEYEVIIEKPHDLGYCPAHFIAAKAMDDDPVVRESIFSYCRYDLEDYVFLKTLLKMMQVNGAIPVTAVLRTESGEDEEDNVQDSSARTHGNEMASQQAAIQKGTVQIGSGILEAGTIHEIDVLEDDNGKLNMDMIEKYIKFFHMPVDTMDRLNEMVQQIEAKIVVSIVGDRMQSNDTAKNTDQIKQGVSNLENTLRDLSWSMSRIRHEADKDYLGLKYGPDRVLKVITNYGSDFYLESIETLLQQFKDAPNVLERKNTLLRLTNNQYKNNPEFKERQIIEYHLIPYISDKDWEYAKDRVDPITFEYQTRFNYWIGVFQSENGDIVEFFNNLPMEVDQKYEFINNLIINIIKNNTNDERPTDNQNQDV